MDGSPTVRLRGPRVLRLLVLLAGLTAAAAACSRGRAPADDSPEAGFARDMATHHAQASEMAFIARDASADERLRALAYDIIVTQSAQRGMFMGWLQQWGLAQSSMRPRMAWMPPMPAPEHSMAPGDGPALMAGMATTSEIDRLKQAAGKDAEILFLQLMIRHHEGGVHMARAVLALSTREDIVTMARAIDSSQSVEITLMTAMLAERGAQPLSSILH